MRREREGRGQGKIITYSTSILRNTPRHKSEHISLMLSPLEAPSLGGSSLVEAEVEAHPGEHGLGPGHSRWSVSLATVWPMPSLPLLAALFRRKGYKRRLWAVRC